MSNEFIGVRQEYVDRIKKELLGPGSEVCIPDAEHELISSAPNVRYSIGILFPQKQCILRDNDDATDDDVLIDEDSDSEEGDQSEDRIPQTETVPDNESEPEESSLDEQIGLAMQNMPSSMGYSFLAKGNCDKLVFKLTFATYSNSSMEDCAYPVPVKLPENYVLPPELLRFVSYDATNNCLRMASKYKKSDIKMLKERDVLPDSEQMWIFDPLYRLYDQLHSGFVRYPHSTTAELDFCQKNYVVSVFEVDGFPVKLTAVRRPITDSVCSVTVMLVNQNESNTKTPNPRVCYFQPIWKFGKILQNGQPMIKKRNYWTLLSIKQIHF